MKKLNSLYPLLTILLIAASCGGQKKTSIRLAQKGDVKLVALGVSNVEDLKQRAKSLGVKIKGKSVLTLSGDAEAIAGLELQAGENFFYFEDFPVKVGKAPSFQAQKLPLYLAKEDFGIPNFWKKRPKADGRGVKVGVIDDGISPHQEGFIKTSDGKRKFLKKNSVSSFTTFALKKSEEEESEEWFIAEIDETRQAYGGKVDLDNDGEHSVWTARVSSDLSEACLDINEDSTYQSDECAGSFSETGDYILLEDARFALMLEIDKENKTLQIFQPEKGRDSHGEGVASVLAGHEIAGLKGFDGVAPGAQILDYDLSEDTNKAEEYEYNISTFLEALDWLGSEGAKVANISYSLFFTSAKTQTYMRKALKEIVEQHNMVVSFSAGNNGPGLGSLNRRGIYPSSVLVAGAYVSKELDEYVHGTTGLPEEGRVVYYSSRGPGLGAGPTLISPLSSLTNSAPDGGHRAFSGTSSASPALAGAAAVLISAIEQEGLEYNAETVVHALRLSGKKLKNEPHIFQGNGLPQVEKALAIYKELAAGKKRMRVEVEVNKQRVDGVASQGILLKASRDQETYSAEVFFKGAMSALAPASARINRLDPVRLEYTAGISGPSRLWVSQSWSSANIDVAPKKMLQNKLEAFGEIRLVSARDNSVLATVPVTVINDADVSGSPSASFELGAQEGKRFHLNVPKGVKGFKVKMDVLQGDQAAARVLVYNPDQVRVAYERAGSEFWVPAEQAGHWQLGVLMRKGTPRGLKLKVSATPLRFELLTKASEADSPEIEILNLGENIVAQARLRPTPEILDRTILSSDELEQGAVIETTGLAKGDYKVKLRPNRKSQLEYFDASCSAQLLDGEEMTLEDSSFSVENDNASVKARCMPFDKGAEFDDKYRWIMSLQKEVEPAAKLLATFAGKKAKSITFLEADPGSYEVELKDPFSDEVITLGTIDLF